MCLPAQTFTTLLSFNGTDGAVPFTELVQAANGDLYGTTFFGGAGGDGTIFKITPSGALTTLHSFCSQSGCMDGANPSAGLVQAPNGDIYGTTTAAGVNGGGTFFKITPSGILTTLYGFCSQSGCTDGASPHGALAEASNGDFYGTTNVGGANPGPNFNGAGTVFKVTPTGALTTLYNFCSQSDCTDGLSPVGTLVEAANGDFYGTTAGGGAGNQGTIFKITPAGKLTTLHSFCGQIGCGASPLAGLVQAPNANFYGTTSDGGAYFSGTLFKIAPNGTLTTLYTFCSQSACTDGLNPEGSLVEAANGDFYGTTLYGGANAGDFGIGAGTVFKITPGGALTTLYSFCSPTGCTDGEFPSAALVQDTNGDFYGTTSGTPFGNGTVFRLSAGLGPFVKTQTSSGKVGGVVEILGTGLTGATSVSFNGTPAVFTVVSHSLIEATVPAGATSGRVQVVTPSRTLLSNVPFRVLP